MNHLFNEYRRASNRLSIQMQHDSMIPKDLIPLIGQYLRPNIFLVLIRGVYGEKAKYCVFAESKEEVYTKIRDSQDLLIDILSYLNLCVVTDDDTVKLQQLKFTKLCGTSIYLFEGCHRGNDIFKVLQNATRKNLQCQPLTVGELKQVLHDPFLMGHHNNIGTICITQIKTH